SSDLDEHAQPERPEPSHQSPSMGPPALQDVGRQGRNHHEARRGPGREDDAEQGHGRGGQPHPPFTAPARTKTPTTLANAFASIRASFAKRAFSSRSNRSRVLTARARCPSFGRDTYNRSHHVEPANGARRHPVSPWNRRRRGSVAAVARCRSGRGAIGSRTAGPSA